MIRKAVIILFFAAALLAQARAQSWVRTYPLKNEEPVAVCALVDGGYVYASSLSGSTGTQVLVFKAKASGLGVWGKAFDAPLSSKAVGCRQLKNGNILVWGDRTPVFDDRKTNSSDGFLLTLSKSGQVVSQWEYGVADWNYEYLFAQAAELAGGGFIACGEIEHLNKSTQWYKDESKGWIVKLDAAGKVVWQKKVALTSSEAYKYVSMTDIREAVGGGYLCVGWYYISAGWSASEVGIIVLKLDAAGAVVWQKAFDAGNYSNGNTFLIESASLFATKDGGCLLVGMDWVDDYPWVVKLNKSGTPTWGRMFVSKSDDSDVEFVAASETKDQGCLIGGGVYPDSGDRLGWFAKVSPSGVLQANRSYVLGGHYYNHYLGMAERRTGGYVLVGRSYDDYYSRELWAMTTKPDGLTCPSVKPNAFKAVMKTFKLYPKSAALRFGEGEAEFGRGVFTATSLTTKSKSWCGASSMPTASVLELRTPYPGRDAGRPRRLKDGRSIGLEAPTILRSLRAMLGIRSSEE